MHEHEFWLGKAASDLKSAKMLSADDETADNAIYHTQQCAEKALKQHYRRNASWHYLLSLMN